MNALPPGGDGWAEVNQRVLMTEVARVCRDLRGQAAPDGAVAGEAGEAPSGSALAAVCAAFRLSPFERDILLMCAAPELDGTAPRTPCFGAAMARLPGAHWSALLPTAPLRWWRLVEAGPGHLADAVLRVDEWVLHVLAGVGGSDERVAGAVRDVPAPLDLPPGHAAAASALARAWQDGEPAQLVGDAAKGAAEVAAGAAALLGCTLSVVPAARVDESWLRLWQREAVLGRRALLIEVAGNAAEARGLADPVRRAATPLAVLHTEPLHLPDLPLRRVPVPGLTPAERAGLLRDALGIAGPNGKDAHEEIDRVAAHFDLGPAAVRAVAAEAGGTDRLWATCARQAGTAFPGGTRIAPASGWDDLVLPHAQETLLRELFAEVRHRHRVHGTWNFGGQAGGQGGGQGGGQPRGGGVTALLHGPSGTGKTLAAEVLAGALGLDLLAVDLSALVSKYIGETEKNLRAAFDAAEASGAVLLFDEADALFGKRSEVRDSHDRHANMEVSYLLQRMEAYRGLAVLTTNMKEALDTAFLRRLRFVVEFPYPGPKERERMWRRAIPPAAPTEDLVFPRLAQISLAGGHIRNIALGAAFMAAADDTPIRMDHLRRAAQRECAKLERPLTPAELAGW